MGAFLLCACASIPECQPLPSPHGSQGNSVVTCPACILTFKAWLISSFLRRPSLTVMALFLDLIIAPACPCARWTCLRQQNLPGTYVAYFIDEETQARRDSATRKVLGSRSILLSYWRLHCMCFEFSEATTWVGIQVLPLLGVVTLGKWLNLCIWGTNIPGTMNSECKGPVAGACCRNSKEARVAGAG